jgi:hypothetical protein
MEFSLVFFTDKKGKQEMGLDSTKYESPQIASLHCEDAMRHAEIKLIAKECGFDVMDKKANETSARLLNGHMFLIDFSSISDKQGQEITNILSYLNEGNARAVVWTDFDRLDVAYALFPSAPCQFLVDADQAEAMLILERASRRGRMDQLHDNSREDGFEELHRMRGEVASFAEALARLAGSNQLAPKMQSLADKPVSFRPAPAGATYPFIEEPKSSAGSWSAKDIRNLIQKRRIRDQFFANGLFADPAWDILLDLMAARLEGKHVSVSSLCIAAAVPATTALRWITGMTESGLLERRMDPDDARRVFIELSQATLLKLEQYFAKLGPPDIVI